MCVFDFLMSLSSSYHDCTGIRPTGSRNCVASSPASGKAVSAAAEAPSAAAPTRSSVRRVGRDSKSLSHGHTLGTCGQRQASPEAASGASNVVVLGTASLAMHRDRELSKPLSNSVPQPLSDSRHRVLSSRHQHHVETSMDGRSSVTISRHPRRSAQPLPSSLNPSFQASVHNARTAESRSTTPSTSLVRDAAAVHFTASMPAASSSTHLVHLRPLSTSCEADYLNFSYQRGFMGRFRCVIPVVVRTPVAATLHHRATRSGAAVADAAAPLKDETMENDESCVRASQMTAHADAVDDESAPTTAAAAAVAERRTHTVATAAAAPHSSSMLSRPRLTFPGSAASVASGSTTRRGRVSGRFAPSVSASVAVSSLPRRSLRSRPTLTEVRGGGASAAAARVPAANMEPLTRSGLHTSLWAATQNGGVEVRSMADPSEVLASAPPSDARTVITALAAVCGNRVVAGHTDGSLRLFDAVTLQAVGEHHPHTAAVTKLLYVHSAPQEAAVTETDGHATEANHSRQLHSLLLTASQDRTITVWEAASMTLLHRLKGNVRGVCALAATSTGGYAFSGSDEGTLRMWDIVRGQQWGITMDERAQLGRRSRKEDLAGSGMVANWPSQRLCEAYTESSCEGDDDEDRDEVEEEGEDGGAGSDQGPNHTTGAAYNRHGRLASPHANGAASPSQLRPPLPTRPPVHPATPHTATTTATATATSHRRLPRGGYGGVKVVPRTANTLSRGALTLQQTGLLARSRGNAGPPLTPPHSLPRSLPAAEDAFAPTDTTTSSTPLGGSDGALAGFGSGISPLRPTLDHEWENGVDGRDKPAPAVHLGYDYSAPAPTRKHRKPKSTTTTKKKARKGDAEPAELDVGEKGGTRVRTKSKGKASSAAKRKKVKKAKKISETTTTTATAAAARLPAGVLGQRLETWIRLYHQRVLHSVTSQQLKARFAAEYDAAAAINWPIECAHVECITALTVVEDRLLVSASYDATAKVFALPSGQHMRTLISSRRMPLSSVLYDSSVGRIYTGFSDGAVSVYDLSSPELPLLSQLQSPQTILSCSFAALATAPMRRFVINAHLDASVSAVSPTETEDAGESGNAAVVTTIAQFDKTTQAHGPNQTTSSYRVGQPSLRELNAAVSLQPLQQRRVAHLTALAKRHATGTLEEKELRDSRQSGLVLTQAHRRRQTTHVFLRWQRWAWRHAMLRQLGALAAARASSVAQRLLGHYMQRWANVVRQRAQAAAGAVLRTVQLKGSDAAILSVTAATRHGLWSALARLAASMATASAHSTLRRAYRRWRELQRVRHIELQQSVCFNTLLLSMDAGGAFAPGCHALTRLTRTAARRAHHAKALWLLTELTERRQSQRQRRHFFDRWHTFAAERRCLLVRREEQAWRLVEPLSSSLVQPRLLRCRYFANWRTFALYVARRGQLRSERETLQGEWATLRRALVTAATVAAMQAKVRVAEAAIADAAGERAALMERVQTLADEDSALRTEGALRVLIAGYYVPDAATTATAKAAAAASPSAQAGITPAAVNTRRASAASSVDSGGVNRTRVKSFPSGTASSMGNAEDTLLTEEEQRDRRLLMEASAVLRALKGNSMQCARDDKLLAKAHALALRLPIYEPLLNDLTASAESTPSRRSGLSQPQHASLLRTTTWSVSSAKNCASTASPSSVVAVAAAAATHQQQQQRRRHSTLSGPSVFAAALSNNGGVGGGSVTAARASAAQMWAAQPAEENYPSLADAFDAIYASLLGLLYGAARECGVAANAAIRSTPVSVESCSWKATVIGGADNAAAAAGGAVSPLKDSRREGVINPKELPENSNGADDDLNALEGVQASAVAPSWLAQVPLKQRRTMVGEVLKLVTLFDSFAAHSDLPVERAGSISTRGAANTRALPLCSLCSRETAQSLLRHAAVLLELADPQLWPRQLKLNYLQDAYAAAIAELNATVSSSHASDARLRSSTIVTRSDSEDRDGSPLPTPHVMRPPALCLSAEVLQRAADALQPTAARTPPMRGMPLSHLDARTSPTMTTVTTTTASSSDRQSTRLSVSKSYAAGPSHSTLKLTNLEVLAGHRSDNSEEKLNGTVKSMEEEGQTPTPDPQYAHNTSFSHRTFSAVSTPRSYTPRTATSSVAGNSTGLLKPYLGFRVNVTRDSHAARRTATTITIRDVAGLYVNAEGAEVDGPALAAGLQAGDQLVRFAGYAVTDLAAFNAIVSRHVHSGAELPVVVQRGEELLSTTIVVGTRAG